MNKVIRYAGVFVWLVAAALILGCAGPKVKRTEVDETIDLSGRWNDTDSRLVAEEMIQDCLSRPWLKQFKADYSHKNPRKELREEKADQLKGFTDEATAKSISEETGADFMLKGSINSIKDEIKGKYVILYQANLELIHLETNKKAWIGEKQIKKYVKRAQYGL